MFGGVRTLCVDAPYDGGTLVLLDGSEGLIVGQFLGLTHATTTEPIARPGVTPPGPATSSRSSPPVATLPKQPARNTHATSTTNAAAPHAPSATHIRKHLKRARAKLMEPHTRSSIRQLSLESQQIRLCRSPPSRQERAQAEGIFSQVGGVGRVTTAGDTRAPTPHSPVSQRDESSLRRTALHLPRGRTTFRSSALHRVDGVLHRAATVHGPVRTDRSRSVQDTAHRHPGRQVASRLPASPADQVPQ
jgi:hypothetical protein